MSDAVPLREWRFYINDMIGFCERVMVLRTLCITPCGLWSAGLGRSTALLF